MNDTKNIDPFANEDKGLFNESRQSGEMTQIFRNSEDVYFRTVRELQSICDTLKNGGQANGNELKNLTRQITEILKQDERLLLGLANSPYSFIERKAGFLKEGIISSYIIVHGVNVMIYALKVSIDIDILDSRLPYVAIAAMTSNLGLLDYSEEKLKTDSSDISKFREYSKKSDKYISKLTIDDFHLASVEQLNQISVDNPAALSRTSLREGMYQYAMVIQLCNEFETLTHQRKYAPIEAMKKLRDQMNNFFHPDIIKMFFDKLSIYPLGSFVKLSSLETAKVIKINENFIMRPVVLIVLDEEGIEKEKPSRVNLREKFNLYIKHPVRDEALTEHFLYCF